MLMKFYCSFLVNIFFDPRLFVFVTRLRRNGLTQFTFFYILSILINYMNFNSFSLVLSLVFKTKNVDFFSHVCAQTAGVCYLCCTSAGFLTFCFFVLHLAVCFLCGCLFSVWLCVFCVVVCFHCGCLFSAWLLACCVVVCFLCGCMCSALLLGVCGIACFSVWLLVFCD